MFNAGGSLSVGIAEIDDDHEVVFELGRKLEEAIITNKKTECIRKKLLALLNAAKDHFENEERILAPLGLPGEKKHKAEHKRLINLLSSLQDNIGDETDASWRRRIIDLNDIMLRHIITFDMEHKWQADNSNGTS